MASAYERIKERLARRIQQNYCLYLGQVIATRRTSMNKLSEDFSIGRTKLRNFEKGKENIPSPDAKAMAHLIASGQLHIPPLSSSQMYDVLLGYANEEGKRSPLVEEISRLAASKPLEQQKKILSLLQGNISDSTFIDKSITPTHSDYTESEIRNISLLLEKKDLVRWILNYANLISKWLTLDREGLTYFIQRYRTFKKLRECVKDLSSSFAGGPDRSGIDGKYFNNMK